MPSYIALLNWTERGIANIKGSPGRLAAGRDKFKDLGCELKDVYLTMGPYDLVCILDAPDAGTAAKAILSLEAEGNVRTLTLPAFTEDEYKKIIDSI
jgi:uncharacterized protein with GYD domain